MISAVDARNAFDKCGNIKQKKLHTVPTLVSIAAASVGHIFPYEHQ